MAILKADFVALKRFSFDSALQMSICIEETRIAVAWTTIDRD